MSAIPPRPTRPELVEQALRLAFGRADAELREKLGHPRAPGGGPAPLVDEDSAAPLIDATVAGADDERDAHERPRLRVKVKLWRFKAEVGVEQNAGTGDLMAWRNYTSASERGDKVIDRKAALEIALAEVSPLPPGATDPSITLRETGDQSSYEIEWYHFADPETIVDGDKIVVRINAATRRVHSVFKKWRRVPGEPPAA